MAWTAAAVVGLLLLMLLRNDDEGSPAPERTAEAEPLPGNPALVPGTANPVPGEEQTEPSEVIEPDSEAPVSTATAPTRTRSLRSVRLPVSTRNGPLTIVRRSGGDVLRLDGDDLGESLARAITLVHQAHYSDREVITGYSGCDAPGPGCRGRVPFWLVLRDNGRAEYRELDEVAASGELPDVVALASGVHVDLGVRDGVRRTAMLTALDDPYLTQQREPRRRLSSSECAEIESALEDCAAVRGCRSIENIERSMPATRVGQVRKMFHETTGLDADGFRSICERSCELGLTPSRGYIQREVCDGAVPGQWRRDIFED